MPAQAFWRGKRVLVTGHTGFKGAWLTLWLSHMGAEVTGYSLAPVTHPNLFTLASIEALCDNHLGDIRDASQLAVLVKDTRPEIVFHLAAQPLVRASYRQPLETYTTNVMGTANLLDSLRDVASVKVAVMITTDKVYRNNEWEWPYRENDALGGHDPYSASKAACEVIIESYRKAFLAEQGVAVASARAGNVIGGGDWSEDRLIPDAIRAWQAGEVLQIRRPSAVRPWQHVLEPLCGYLQLAEKLYGQPLLAGAYNFGPNAQDVATVRKVIDQARAVYGRGEVCYGDGQEGPHEAGLLALDIAKSIRTLGYRPRWTLKQAVERTFAWYLDEASKLEASSICYREIALYESYLLK